MKKILSLIMTVVMLFTVLSVPGFAVRKDVDFTIENPYKNIDWDSWKGYKTQLHCHTTASDGYQTIKEAITDYYALDYDVVAITDHGTMNKGWNIEPDTIPIVRAIKKERTGGARNPIIPLTADEYIGFTSGNAKSIEFSYIADNQRINTGRTRTHSNGLLDVEKGNELNMATPIADCHLTGYWSDYGQGYAGVFGDYETPSKGVKLAGGLSMLAHIGEYVYTDKDSADHAGQKIDEYYVNKFARIFLDNAGSSVGMGINSATDEHTRCDRILYDQILQKTIPNGVVPWGFSFSDSHSETSINDAYTIMYMPELSNSALRSCMLNGEFFSVSHYSNGYELNGLKEQESFNGDCNSVEWWKDNTPKVTKVEVDEERDVIKVWGENFNYITWISDGNVVLRDYKCSDGYAELDLHDEKVTDKINMFVRFYISGDNGICYSQPMVVKRDGETFTPVNVPKTHDISTFLRGLVTVFDWTIFKFNPIIWAFKYFALGYDPIEQAVSSVVDLFK
ncbi:MAG: PHP domain-containing protein [Ruminococcus sp.]|nr:PHP domain-containing protein [Candidatus Copronaster equi]